MAIAERLRVFLDQESIAYDTVEHPRTECSSRTAQAAHIPGDQVLKSVVIRREQGPLLAVVPSTHRIELSALQDILETRLGLASEMEVRELFDDCAVGAVPPIGAAYDLPVIVGQDFSDLDDVYFEAGDHKTLVHVHGTDMKQLLRDAMSERFSRHV